MADSQGDMFKIFYGNLAFSVPKRPTPDFILAGMERRKAFYELDLLEALRSEIGSGPGIAIDCGANIGNHSLFLAGVMGLDVISIEPIPANIEILTRFIDMNDLQEKITIVPNAIGQQAGYVSLGLANVRNPGMYRIGESRNALTVAAITLDSYLSDHHIDLKTIRILKIDVEGQELSVLKGADTLLKCGTPLITAELSEVAAFNDFSAWVSTYGYHPIGIFCATPTVLFKKVDAELSMKDAVLSKLKQFELRVAGK